MDTEENVSTTHRGRTNRGLVHLADTLRARRKIRLADRRLAKDLSCYTTRRQLDELLAIMERYDEAETAHVRRVLDRRFTAA